jgi:hypothetical protein
MSEYTNLAQGTGESLYGLGPETTLAIISDGWAFLFVFLFRFEKLSLLSS